jgi:LysR family glycine cleavage system transcriptional activator
VFEAAARLENFTAAAVELGMTQAAVSYQVKLLEERLGIGLFHRTGRKVVLTERGRSLAPAIIRAFDEMRQGFAALAGESSAVLTISCTNSFANLWLAPRLGIFQMRQPGLAVRIHSSDTLVDFARDGVDLAIRGGKGAWPGLDARLLAHNRLSALCSPAFLAANGPILDARALRSLTLLSPDDIWWHEWFADMGVEHDRGAGPPAIALDSQVMEGRAAMAGQGVAILNTYLWKAEIEAGLLVEAVPSNMVESRSYWVVYPHHARNTPKVKAFRDWICAEFAAEQAKDPEGRYMPVQ